MPPKIIIFIMFLMLMGIGLVCSQFLPRESLGHFMCWGVCFIGFLGAFLYGMKLDKEDKE